MLSSTPIAAINQNAELDYLVLAPDWLRNLILYEIATKSYTSPNGPESGTFESLRARLPYLQELGVTGIWLTGHSLSDPKHFYGIWTQYACIDPAIIDPTLGTPDDFRRLIDDAHAHGIKVILDVITHGVMNDSPLVQDHPDWFKGGSWGMTDFDWFGNHPDLDEWWVKTWVDYVANFNIDGFRLDVATYRWDLWQRIRRQAADLGHPIIVVTEHGPGHVGVNDFFQRGAIRLSIQTQGLDRTSPMLNDVAGYVHRMVTPDSAHYAVRVECADRSVLTTEGAAAKLTIAARRAESVIVQDPHGTPLWLEQRITLDVNGVSAGAAIDDVIVDDGQNQEWHYNPWGEVDCTAEIERTGDQLRLHFLAKYPPGQWLAVQLSSHDNGWDGFPLGQNPYAAQGSRFVFGYGLLLAPVIPLFMAGEEFNAGYRPLPMHSPRLFGGESIGEGRWLYGSWIDWSQLEQPERLAMLEDVTRLIAIRKQFAHLVYPLRVGDGASHLHAVACTSADTLPVPYLYARPNEALLVAGNPNTTADAQATLNLPLAELGWQPTDTLVVDDLWAESNSRICKAADFGAQAFQLASDGVRRGGLLVLHIRKE